MKKEGVQMDLFDLLNSSETDKELTISPFEVSIIKNLIAKKTREVMGGEKSAAYSNSELRRKVCFDIMCEVKRGCRMIDTRWKRAPIANMKRKYFATAVRIIDEYVTTRSMDAEIEAANLKAINL